MWGMLICSEKGVVTEAGNRDDDGYGDRKKGRIFLKDAHISVSWLHSTKKYLEITSVDKASWIFY